MSSTLKKRAGECDRNKTPNLIRREAPILNRQGATQIQSITTQVVQGWMHEQRVHSLVVQFSKLDQAHLKTSLAKIKFPRILSKSKRMRKGTLQEASMTRQGSTSIKMDHLWIPTATFSTKMDMISLEVTTTNSTSTEDLQSQSQLNLVTKNLLINLRGNQVEDRKYKCRSK